jgi:DHA3 family macrolide efflux protein-like MFS transporter
MDEKRALRQFFIIWSGQALSLLGSRLVQFALIWWLTKTTESATVLAMASLVGLLPQVVLGPFVGVLVDRWRRRWVMFGSDGLVALATLVLAVLFWQDAVQVWHVFVILFVRALAGSFHWPAMQASTTLMVPERLFTRIQGLNQTLQGGLNVAAAPLGALLLEVSTMHSILAIDIATALVAMLPLLFIAIPQPERKVEVAGQIASFWDELHDGLRYVRSHRGLRMLITMAVMVNLVLVPTFSLMPILVTNHFSGEAVQLAWMEALSGAGIVVGGALLGAWGGFRRKILTTQTGLLGMGLAVLVVGLTPSALFWLAVAAMFGVGLSMALTNGPILAILQTTVAPDLQGRVFTLLNSLVTLATPVGLIIAGPVADLLGVQMWFVAGGLVTALVGVFGFFSTALMSIEDGPAQAVVEQVVV